MRINMKCDKNYNSSTNINLVSSGCFDNELIEEIVRRFIYLKNGKINIDVTEGLVDFYNTTTDDVKSAQSIGRYLRRSWIEIYAEEIAR